MRYVGIDPGSRCSGIAVVDGEGKILQVKAVPAPDVIEMSAVRLLSAIKFLRLPFGGPTIFAVESQEYRHARAKGSPDLLVPLAQVAGAALAHCAQHPLAQKMGFELVLPSVWKGSQEKIVCHRRMMQRIGWKWWETNNKEPYCVPEEECFAGLEGGKDVGQTQWKEVLDAIGIALWLRDKHERNNTSE